MRIIINSQCIQEIGSRWKKKGYYRNTPKLEVIFAVFLCLAILKRKEGGKLRNQKLLFVERNTQIHFDTPQEVRCMYTPNTPHLLCYAMLYTSCCRLSTKKKRTQKNQENHPRKNCIQKSQNSLPFVSPVLILPSCGSTCCSIARRTLYLVVVYIVCPYTSSPLLCYILAVVAF